MDDYLDPRSADLTVCVRKMRTRTQKGHEEMEYTGARGICQGAVNVSIRTMVPEEQTYVYYIQDKFYVSDLASEHSPVFSTQGDLSWYPVPEPVDDVYLHKDLMVHEIPWSKMIQDQKWDLLEHYLQHLHSHSRSQGVAIDDFGTLKLRELFLSCDIPTFERLNLQLPCNIRGITACLRPEDLGDPEKRQWIVNQVSQMTGIKAASYPSRWIPPNRIEILQSLKILPKLNDHLVSTCRDTNIANLPELLRAMTSCSPDILSVDMEILELWDILGVAPVYQGSSTKSARP